MNRDDPSVVAEQGSKAQRPTVQVFFTGYSPPFDAAPIVRRMLDSVPEKYLVGLREVVLTNASGLSRKLRRSVTKSRRRKVRFDEAAGLYHPTFNGKPAWIEIFLDNTLRGWESGWWLRIPLIREGKLADILFHEIGHHIHFTCRPEYREKEDVADVWLVRLRRDYNRKRFPLMTGFVRFVRFLSAPFFDRQRGKLMSQMLQKGMISQAEYEEQVGKGKPGKLSVRQ
jgi:hypothetical protein